MSGFTFDFDLGDDLDESLDATPLQEPATAPSIGKNKTLALEHHEPKPGTELPAEEIPLSTLLSALPEALSYSPLKLPGPSGDTLARRDLFDARFQLLARDERDERTAAFVDAPADLIPGAYEGGLKTWECALDLAVYLDRDVIGSHAGGEVARPICGSRVLELGCGTAVPTLLLLDRLFSHLASKPAGARGSPCDGDTHAGSKSTSMPSVQETDIHLQDYNRSVLELVTFPNVLLTWYTSPLSAAYRASAAADSDDDVENGEETIQGNAAHTAHAYRRGPGGLTVTPALLDAFTASLDAHKVRLRFFAGGWSTLRECLVHQGSHQPPPSYDIVLASETIYRTEALRAFLGVLRTATAATPTAEAAPACDREAISSQLCLVAAKVLYFGVGGGVQAFVSAVEREHGTVHTVWEHREGVGRVIMRIEW